MIVLVSLIVLLGRFPCFHDFSHGASHPYILIHQLNACSTYMYIVIFLMVAYKRSYAYAYMRRLARAAL